MADYALCIAKAQEIILALGEEPGNYQDVRDLEALIYSWQSLLNAAEEAEGVG